MLYGQGDKGGWGRLVTFGGRRADPYEIRYWQTVVSTQSTLGAATKDAPTYVLSCGRRGVGRSGRSLDDPGVRSLEIVGRWFARAFACRHAGSGEVAGRLRYHFAPIILPLGCA